VDISLLGDLIWQASEKLAFDLGVRQARINLRPDTEVRAGMTFALSALGR
jgi:outer membrane receptor protein involved in Fe transport